ASRCGTACATGRHSASQPGRTPKRSRRQPSRARPNSPGTAVASQCSPQHLHYPKDGASMAYDLLVLNGTLVTPEDSREQDIAVDGEKIAAVADRGGLGNQAAKVIDAAGCLVIPGGVDPHVHYAMHFDPVVTEGPEFSEACAYGGTTTIVDFAFHEPNGSVQGSIDAKKADFDGTIAVDYGLHVIMTKGFSFGDVEEIGDVIRNGVPTVKTMMTYGYISDDGQRWGLMNEVGKQGGMSVVHAEDDAIA